MEIKQFISVFNRDTEELIQEVEVNIPIDILKEIFTPYSDDSEMIMAYSIDEKSSLLITGFATLVWDFQGKIYEFATYQV